MAIKRKTENKFEAAATALKAEEETQSSRTRQVVSRLSSDGKSRIITDKTGRVRVVRVPEKRKSFPVYVPESLQEKFSEKCLAEGLSMNAAVNRLIRDWVGEQDN